MQKTAQKRSILNKLREMTNISGIAAEKFFNPEFQRVMESLREKDSAIRAIIAGTEIEGADPGPDPISLKDLLKSSKSNFNRREYMTAVAELGRFHKKLFDVIQIINNLNLDVDKIHHEFLFKDLPEEHKQQLESLKTRFATKQKEMLIKEASIMDFFYNIGTKRGRALAAWEKRYPKQIGKLKKDTSSLLSRSEAILSQTLSALKEMATARATRNVDNYIKAADKINKSYQNYDKIFKEYYTSNIKNFLEKVELIAPVVKVPDAKEIGKQEVPIEKEISNEPQSNIPIPLTKAIEPDTIPQGTPPNMTVEPYGATVLAPGKTPSIPPPPALPVGLEPLMAPNTVPAGPPSFEPESEEIGHRSDKVLEDIKREEAKKIKSNYKDFINSLEALSNESPILLAAYIKKYAKSIEHTNPEISIQLFNLIKSIRG